MLKKKLKNIIYKNSKLLEKKILQIKSKNKFKLSIHTFIVNQLVNIPPNQRCVI